MEIVVNVSQVYEFKTKDTIYLLRDIEPDYTEYPTSKGVYIFHYGKLDDARKNKDELLYIGAANRETLRCRIRKNWRGKILVLLKGDRIPNKKVYVSYCELSEDVPDYIPFLIEGKLLFEFRSEFNEAPIANTGRR